MSLLDSSGGELSLRHLPDDSDTLSNTSNTSFSFQIPQGVSITDNLLAEEDGEDFFRNAQADASEVDAVSPVSLSALDKPKILLDLENGKEGSSSRVVSKLVEMSVSLPKLSLGDLDHHQQDTLSNATRIQRPKLCINTKPPTGSTSTQDAVSHPPLDIVSFSAPSNSQGEFIPASATQADLPAEERQVAPDEKSSINNNQPPEGIRKEQTNKTDDDNIERKRRIPRSRRTVIEGGIIKPRILQSKKALEIPSRAILLRDSEPPVAPLAKQTKAVKDCHEVLLEDASTSSISLAGVVAARLMEYGQKYVNGNDARHNTNAFPLDRIFNDYERPGQDMHPVPEAAPSQMPSEVANDDIQDDRDKPLTLSQLSPRKLARTTSPVPETSVVDRAPNMSPVRPANKRRVAIESSSDEPKLKKSKGDDFKTDGRAVTASRSNSQIISKPRLPSTRMQKQGLKSSINSRFASSSRVRSVSSSVSGPSGRSIRKAKNRIISTGKAPAFNPGTGWNDDVQLPDERNATRQGSSSTPTSSINLLTSRTLDQKDKEDKLLDTSVPFVLRSAPSSKTNTGMRAEQQHTKEKETVPLGSRSMSRSLVQSEKHRFYHPPPNFKAIHAALDASLAQRKENIHPTVPLAMQWETDLRMQERRKFDEKVKEREREREKEEEERKRLRETEEEGEVRELRKRLVVKAHDVPEWYSKMPKSKRKEQAEVTGSEVR